MDKKNSSNITFENINILKYKDKLMIKSGTDALKAEGRGCNWGENTRTLNRKKFHLNGGCQDSNILKYFILFHSLNI